MPDNAFYYHAAYTIAVAVYGAYTISLIVRRRRLRQRDEAASRSGVAPGTGR